MCVWVGGVVVVGRLGTGQTSRLILPGRSPLLGVIDGPRAESSSSRPLEIGWARVGSRSVVTPQREAVRRCRGMAEVVARIQVRADPAGALASAAGERGMALPKRWA